MVVVGSPFPSSYFTLSQSFLFLSFLSFFLLLFPFCGFHDLSVSFQALIYETCIHTYTRLSLTRSNPRDTVSLCAVGRSCDSLREKRPTIADIMSTHAGAAEAGRAGQQLQYVFYQVLSSSPAGQNMRVWVMYTHT